MSDSLVDDMRS